MVHGKKKNQNDPGETKKSQSRLRRKPQRLSIDYL